MSSPADFYNTLPPVSKAYGTICVATTIGFQLGLIPPQFIALDYDLVTKKLQIWRLLTNFFFLGPFSMQFGMRLLMIARYGVQLEKLPFDKRTADFLWMMLVTAFTALALGLAIPALRFPFMGNTLVFMLMYVWSREFSTARVNIMGLVQLQGFYLPWAVLLLNTMFGAPMLPDFLGIIIGHAYYFTTVLHPRAGGQQFLRTPLWVNKVIEKWNLTDNRATTPVQQASRGQGGTFTGRSYRLNQS